MSVLSLCELHPVEDRKNMGSFVILCLILIDCLVIVVVIIIIIIIIIVIIYYRVQQPFSRILASIGRLW